MDIYKYVGDVTTEKMRGTRAHMFARALADLLYSCDAVAIKSTCSGVHWEPVAATTDTKDGEKKFVSPLHIYVGDRIPKGEIFLAGYQNGYIDVRKMLGELMHELECIALKEVT